MPVPFISGIKDLFKLILPVKTADTDADTDGDVWYRSDTDVIKARLNGSNKQVYPPEEVSSAIAGAGLAGSGGVLNVAAGDTSLTVNADELHVNMAASGGLQVSSGLKVRGAQVRTSTPGDVANGDLWYRSDQSAYYGRFGGFDDVFATLTDVTNHRGRPLVDNRTSDTSAINSTTLVDVCTVTLPATGTYTFEATIHVQGNATANTPGITVNGTSTPSSWRWVGWHAVGSTASPTPIIISTQSGTTSYAGAVATADQATNTSVHQIHVKGTVTVSATGTLRIQMSRTAGTGSFTAEAGSILRVDRVS